MTSQRLTALEEADLRAEYAECTARRAEIDEVLMRDKYGDTPLVSKITETARRLRTIADAANATADQLREEDRRFSKPLDRTRMDDLADRVATHALVYPGTSLDI